MARLVRDLGGEDNERAVASLARLGADAAPSLVEVLVEEPLERAWQAMRALRRMGAHAAIVETTLMRLLREREVEEPRRAMAAAALGGLGVDGTQSVVPLLRLIEAQPPGEVAVLATIALSEIGPGAAFRLGKELGTEDAMTTVLAASGLAMLGADARRASKELQATAESLALGDERNFYLVQSIARTVLDQLGVTYTAAPDAGAQLGREIGPEIRLRFCRGGRLDRSFLEQPAQALPMLRDAFERLRETELEIAVPEHLEDVDGDGLFSVGELVRGLSEHLSHELAQLARTLERDGFESYAAWREASRGTRGLALAVFELTRPSFVRRALYLDLVSRPFFGLLPPTGKERH